MKEDDLINAGYNKAIAELERWVKLNDVMVKVRDQFDLNSYTGLQPAIRVVTMLNKLKEMKK